MNQNAISQEPAERQNLLTPGMIQSVKGIGPWARFLAIMGFISVGFMLIVSAFMLVAGILGGTLSNDLGGAALLILMTILYVIMAVVYIFPALYLWQTASAVVRLKGGAIQEGMETVLEKQRKFWKFVGIVVIVFLVLYPVMMFLFIGGSLLANLGH